MASRIPVHCALCGEGDGKEGRAKWVLDKNGEVREVEGARLGKTIYSSYMLEPEAVYDDALEGAMVCECCLEQVTEYGSRVLVYAPGADPQKASFKYYVDSGIVVDAGGEDYEARAWARAVGRARAYHRTDGWRDYTDTPTIVPLEDGGKLVRVADKSLLQMENDEEVLNLHEKVLATAAAHDVRVATVVHLTSNVFSTLVQHYVLEADAHWFGQDENEQEEGE